MTRNSGGAGDFQARGETRTGEALRGPEADRANGRPRQTVAIHTHGCKLNQADSEALARRFVDSGYRVVDWADGADVLVLNTCTVTAAADAKARQALRAARRANGGAFIVATGCYAQRAAGELGRLGTDALVVGNTDKDQLVSNVTAALAGRPAGRVGRVVDPPSAARPAPVEMVPSPQPGAAAAWSATGRNRAMIKIQEGCNQVCAYCVVPRVRGRERSIPPEAVLAHINERVRQGCREVVLTGTQLGAYGYDIAGEDLWSLLQRVLSETTVPRIRVSSLQPQEISPELLDLWADPRLCPHFHIPLQSGSDRILTAMRRRYDTARFARTVEMVRRALPDAGITTDMLIGFPGEGNGEFQESRDFALSMRFSDMHVFPYSARPGTSATRFSGQVPEPEKRARAAEMLEIAGRGFQSFRRGQLGSTRPVLWESARGAGPAPVWSGLTDNYIRVCAEDRRDLHNEVTPARLEALAGDWVTARTR